MIVLLVCGQFSCMFNVWIRVDIRLFVSTCQYRQFVVTYNNSTSSAAAGAITAAAITAADTSAAAGFTIMIRLM